MLQGTYFLPFLPVLASEDEIIIWKSFIALTSLRGFKAFDMLNITADALWCNWQASIIGVSVAFLVDYWCGIIVKVELVLDWLLSYVKKVFLP